MFLKFGLNLLDGEGRNEWSLWRVCVRGTSRVRVQLLVLSRRGPHLFPQRLRSGREGSKNKNLRLALVAMEASKILGSRKTPDLLLLRSILIVGRGLEARHVLRSFVAKILVVTVIHARIIVRRRKPLSRSCGAGIVSVCHAKKSAK